MDITKYLFAIINDIATMLIMTFFLFKVHPLSALVFVSFVSIYIPVNYWLLKKQMVINESSAKIRQRTVGIVNDSISNIFGIKIIGSPIIELKSKLKPAVIAWKDWDKKVREFDAYFVDNADTLMSTAMSAIQIYLLAYLYKQGAITAGGFAFVIMMIIRIHSTLSRFIENILFNINPNLAKIKSSYEFVHTRVDVEDRSSAYDLQGVKGGIQYSNVNFSYGKDKKLILSDFNLNVMPGERLGVVGMSGAGKTTLMKCLLRYFDVDSGSILIDGNDIKAITQQSLRDAISIIPQDITMFHRTIQENLRLAKPNATDKELIAACKKANIHNDIMQMPEGYETIVGERGIKLSGGQRQRVAIARAILKNTPILILDEATSSLDTATEQLIQSAINEVLETSKATVIAIAHRLSTIKHMDRIIVLDNGKIVEEGNHNSLIRKKGGRYKKLWELQAI
jgi:ATP-binding cassette subfamily B protein